MTFKRKNKGSITDAEKKSQTEAFLANADKTPEEIKTEFDNVEKDKNGNPYSNDPKAPRNYKLMTARFNKYEIGLLDELSKIYGVDRMNVLRIAYVSLAKENDIL